MAMDFFLEQVSTFYNVCAVVGTLYLLILAVRLCRVLAGVARAYFFAPCGVGGVELRKFGQWGVVTGASEGIGRGYALELAKRGLNVVLMSRSQEKLEKVAKEIRETYQREALVIPVDFTDGQAIYPRLQEKLKDLEIGVLVNNVGLAQKPLYLLEVSSNRHRNIVEVNCQSVIQMTHLLLPGMVGRGRGAVINISSYTAVSPFQLICVYAATKIFVNYFSEALAAEYAPRGILVQNVMPHLVSTAMTKIKDSTFAPSGAEYAKAAVQTIGIEDVTYGCLPHTVVCSLCQIMPKSIFDRFHFSVLSHARRENLRRALQNK